MNRKIIFILTFVLAIFLMMCCVSAEGLLDFLNNTDFTTANNDTTLVVGFNSNFPLSDTRMTMENSQVSIWI